MPRRQARTKMPKRKPGKAQRKVTNKKPVKRKSSGKKRQGPPLKYAYAVLKELKKENPKATLRDAIPIAKKSYNKSQTNSWNVPTDDYSLVSMPKKKDSWNVSTSKFSTVSMPKKAQSLPMSSQGSYDLDAWMPGKSKKKGKKGSKSRTRRR